VAVVRAPFNQLKTGLQQVICSIQTRVTENFF
jgi:hypothetical protein